MKNNKITAEEQDTDKHFSERKACRRKWLATLFPSSDRDECALAEDCIDLAHQVCKLAAVDIKKKKVEIAHRMKNGDIIVKFTDRPTGDELYAKQVN